MHAWNCSRLLQHLIWQTGCYPTFVSCYLRGLFYFDVYLNLQCADAISHWNSLVFNDGKFTFINAYCVVNCKFLWPAVLFTMAWSWICCCSVDFILLPNVLLTAVYWSLIYIIIHLSQKLLHLGLAWRGDYDRHDCMQLLTRMTVLSRSWWLIVVWIVISWGFYDKLASVSINGAVSLPSEVGQ